VGARKEKKTPGPLEVEPLGTRKVKGESFLARKGREGGVGYRPNKTSSNEESVAAGKGRKIPVIWTPEGEGKGGGKRRGRQTKDFGLVRFVAKREKGKENPVLCL